MKNVSTKSNKKVAKMTRKLLRNTLDDRFKSIKDIIKPCPRFVPFYVWVKLVNLVIDMKIWENKSNNK